MAYPGNGQRMSNYGLKTPTPEESKLLWIEIVAREKKIRANHLATKGNNSAEWPGIQHQLPSKEEMATHHNYFNNEKRHQPNSTYDRLFHVKQGYQCKLHRDDREHTIGLDVHGEESQKVIPVLSSSAYGHREALEGPCRQHARIERVMKGFYRTRGTNLPAYGMDDKKDCSQ
ncbi:cilia- and flagella-associated protein 90-like [Apostichopus japonicus]|uniref:cilia- and flagella-associated protein 90-like n=1 Tax=Stichopus japonicus TaxID=307972 RepID=UPI003AB410D0